MPNNNTRDTTVFVIVMILAVLAYQVLILGPIQKRQQAEAQRAAAAQVASQKAGVPLAPDGQPVVVRLSRAAALAATPRVPLQTPSLTGSISLVGARIDDLFLCGTNTASPPCYRQTTDANSPAAELLRPAGAENAYYAVNGWTNAATNAAVVSDATSWTATSAGPLTPDHPLELSYASPEGLVFHRQIAIDKDYLFTVTDTVQNPGAAPVSLTPYGGVVRQGVPADLGKTAMEGGIGVVGGALKEYRYSALKKDGEHHFPGTTGGWMGITDKYWMTTFVPNQSEPLANVQFRETEEGGTEVYEATYVGQARTLAPGASSTEVTHIFAGAKVVKILDAYGAALHTPNFDKAVDWGVFEIVVKFLFQVLDFYAGHLPNFGYAILALTITIRVVMFPLFNASYSMSTKMKKVQPEMKALQEKFKADPAALQKEMMALYAREKINPVTGCIPMLLPLPVFFALSKLFTVTIEMRHANFGWVHDLSAPDPTTIWNLFGLLPWDPLTNGVTLMLMHLPIAGGIFSLIFHLGVWPIIYAVTMWLSQVTGPPMTGIDPTQQRLMRLMPWFFMFIFSQYAVGLVIYWSFSSVFTFVQQYVLMRRFKVDNPIDDFFARFTAPKAAG